MFVAELCPPVGTFGWPSPSLRLPYRCIANKRLPPDPRSRNGGEVGGAELCLFSRFYERSAFDGVLSGTCAEGYSAPPLRSAQDRPQKRRGGRRRTKKRREKEEDNKKKTLLLLSKYYGWYSWNSFCPTRWLLLLALLLLKLPVILLFIFFWPPLYSSRFLIDTTVFPIVRYYWHRSCIYTHL